MSYQRIIQDCAILNRVFTAFFLNECSMKDGIDFEDSKPTMPQIACHNKEGIYFTEKDSPHGLKHFFQGRVEIPEFDLEKFRTMKINEFFDEDLQGKITDVARFFSNAVKAHEYCDFVFSSLPDGEPFIYDCLLDPVSNFRARLIIGSNLMTNTYSAVWEFYCLLMERFREVEDHPIYGKSSKAVSYMTEEERAKYNKQPVKAEKDE